MLDAGAYFFRQKISRKGARIFCTVQDNAQAFLAILNRLAAYN